MRGLTRLEMKVLEAIQQGFVKCPQIAQHIGQGVGSKEVSRLVGCIRKKFMKGNANAVYIFTTKNGYSLEETPDTLKYEGIFRLKRGTSIILNGRHVYNRCRMISTDNFRALRLEFYPKTEKIAHEIINAEKIDG